MWVVCLGVALMGCDDTGGQGTGSGQNNAPGNNAPNNAPGNHDPVNNDPGDLDAGQGDSGQDAGMEDPECVEGERRCALGAVVEGCQEGVFVAIDECLDQELCQEGVCVRQASCDPGEIRGCFDASSLRVCNEEGTAFVPEACDEGLNCLEGECTDMICVPESRRCVDRERVEICDEAGMAFANPEPCPEGALCLDGRCLSGCDLSAKLPSYIGCRYWSLDLDQYNDPFGDPAVIPHAVVISNPSDQEAVVTVTTMANVPLDPPELVVAPGGVGVYTFPRLDVDGTGISNHSFFLQSSWPVVAYQFNPLNNEGVASNDASLLFPVAVLGREYIALSWPTTPLPEPFGLPPQHGYITIVATSPDRTTIRVKPTADVEGGDNVPFLPEGEEQTFVLRQFQVLNLEADGSNLFALQDLSGTEIIADKPIAVFGGHEEAVVGDGCCAEHLEQQMYPVATWGLRYLAVQSEPRGGSSDVWRVVASVDGTRVETVPPQPGAASFTLNRGQWREIVSGGSFEVVATGPIMVGQYLESQEATGDVVGDPAFILAPPIDSFREDYSVLTPEDYREDWLTVMRPAGVEIALDGQALPNSIFQAFGGGEFEYAWVPVEDGPHTLVGAAPFGLTAYGFSGAVSYGYTGGMNLRVEEDDP